AIAHILGTLDDKIELNHKMNQTLEDIAKAIFKSWFVDFDPVRAKAEGRPISLPPEISDLFPDELVDSEIGEIPKGWDLVPLGDHTELTKGRSYKSAELMDSDTALVTLKSFKRGGGYRLDGLKPYVGTFKPEQVVVEGELIIALTDVTQAADVIGKPAIVRSSSKHTKLVASLDVGIVRANESSLLTREFCYFLMLSERYTQHSLGYTSGTTVLHLAKDASAKFEVSIPPAGLVNRFSEIASNLMKRIFVAEKESETLSELRDTLLPKLISGELRIPDAEKFLEEAGL
ncbi:restriction endonuclease subunit S, partial [bacterium]|nr:restriction endonuclease subunit S [bacterium]